MPVWAGVTPTADLTLKGFVAKPVPELAAERELVTNPTEEDAVSSLSLSAAAAAAAATATESTVRRVLRGDPGDPTRRMGDAALLPLPLPLFLVP